MTFSVFGGLRQPDNDGSSMSDDSFIREVNEEIRQEQAQGAVGPLRSGAASSLAVAGRARHRRLSSATRYWDEIRANRSGDAYSQALQLANAGKNDEALAALDKLEKDGYGAYPLLARMRAATV